MPLLHLDPIGALLGLIVVLHALEAMGVLATFFVTGEQVRAHPSVARDAVAAGHEIAVKGDGHRNVLRVSPWTLRDDLRHAEDAIVTATGVLPRFHRPQFRPIG